MFASDRDLLILEPGLYRDVKWNGQRLLSGVGDLDGTTLTLLTGSFTESGIDAGHVVLIDSVPMEVVSVQSSTSATVSIMRGDTDSVAVGGKDVAAAVVEVFTFEPQIAIVHRQVLSMVGIDVDDPDGLGESAVTNPGALIVLEALGALHLIYASAGAPGRGGEAYLERAKVFQQRFSMQRGHVTAMIDLDGDGIAETRRHPNSFLLSRG
ncbi:MAG: hypothetical protein ACSHX5_10190 [Phycisphaerales bacterium]